MKLWILRPMDYSNKLAFNEIGDPWSPWYDKCFGFVIAAESEQRAREIATEEAGDEKRTIEGILPWMDSRYSSCLELEVPKEEGVVMQEVENA